MPAQDIVNIVTNLQAPPLSGAAFGVPLIAALLSGAQEANWGGDLIRTVTPATFAAEMSLLGVSSSEDLYVALQTMFTSQQGAPTPAECKIGRRATAEAQVSTLTVAQNIDGTYTVTLNGTDYDTVVSGAADVTAVRDSILAALGGAGVVDGVTIASSGADAITFTAAEAGVPFTLSTTHSTTPAAITDVVTTANVGIGEDVAAWRSEDDNFYAVLETSRSAGVGDTLSAAIELTGANGQVGKICLLQSNDGDANTVATTDLGYQLGPLGLNRVRTGVVYSGNNDQFVDAALLSKMLPKLAGAATWANQSLSGVTGESLSSTTNLRSKNYNWLEAFPASQGGFSMTQGGTVAAGYFLDQIRGRDWLNNRLLIALLTLLRDNDRIPFTDLGISQVEAVVAGVLEEASSPTRPILDRSSIVITPPKASDYSSAQRATRRLPNMPWRAQWQGAIHGFDSIQGDIAA